MNTLTKDIIKGIAVGLLASFIKSIAEPPLQKLGESLFPPKPDELDLRGADVTYQPENMPPAVLAKEIYKNICHKELSYNDTLQSMKVIHYTLGTAIGITYVLLANNNKYIKAGEGSAAGIAIWAFTHGSAVPALGLQGKVSEMPTSWWVWEFGSHIIFGLAMEQSRKILNQLLN
jgi:putative membrane protein